MANWSNPQLTSTYTDFVTEVKDRDIDLAKQFDGQTVSNLTTGTIRWDSSANRWKKWTSGNAWGELATTYALTNVSTTGTGTFGGNVTISGSLDATSTASATAFIPDGSATPANGMYLPSANTLGFATNSSPAVFIASDGDVGINDSTPSAKLDVNGGIKAKGTDGYTFNSNDTDGGMFSGADNQIQFKTNNTPRLTISGTNVGIGDVTPDARFHVHEASSSACTLKFSNTEGSSYVIANSDELFYQADGHRFRNEAGSEKVVIDTDNTRLIVGATSASHNLHVQGTAKITGALTVDGGINATITGNAATATDLSINATNKLLYQSSNNDTGTLAAGTSGQLLQSNGSSAPSWVDAGGTVPIGGIIVWSGAQNAIPSGWALCNGSSSTPDLRNRFVVGAGSTYSVGNTGGSANAITVSHTHSTASGGSHGHGVSDPGHTHSYNRRNNTSVHSFGDSNQNRPSTSFSSSTSGSGTTGITITSGGSHSHSVNSTGSSGTNANLPPYYALCYIMRTS